ncbi:hypothetical protein K458DRAFT_391869 [Lentithecium fluviatile CBS 122367]|uniref:BTB domain-containing protein n=1 Tax=Lentithecium fluviatile CBS 122367 TaxID=1168545 RepID=A0A6G1ITJ6_9PLEO|nr:hypothetical protein K458DRAFT_391869 [Lentithecium fluviatile CBS 122367]
MNSKFDIAKVGDPEVGLVKGTRTFYINHQFKAHTAILAKKSSWFAKHTLQLGKDRIIDLSRTDMEVFKSVIAFCYQGSYAVVAPPGLQVKLRGPSEASHNIHVYQLNTIYNVDALVDYSVSKFKDDRIMKGARLTLWQCRCGTIWKLFKTGIFSNVIIPYGQGHTFKVHSVVLSPRSTWFANRHKGRAEIVEEGPSPDTLRLFNHHRLVPCTRQKDDNEAAKRCVPAWRFEGLLRYCYTGISETPREKITREKHWYDLDFIRDYCTASMYTYFIAKWYGVSMLLLGCAKTFAATAIKLRALNTICNLPGLDQNDLLRIEAGKQAKLIADGTTVDITQELIQKALKDQVKCLMPKAGAELFAQGYQLNSSTAVSCSETPQNAVSNGAIPNSAITCTCCLRPLTSTLSHLCTVYPETSTDTSPLEVRSPFLVGLDFCRWKCQGCGCIWQSEAPRTRCTELMQCQMCVLQGRRRRVAPKACIEWACVGCRTVWKAYGTVQQKGVAMDACVCCL